jgi:uncharacterized protein (TIGR03083 family)
MEIVEHVVQLRRDGERLGEVVSVTDPDTPVPTCPGWQVRDLVRHVGGVHRWATEFVSGGGDPDADLERLAGGWPDDAHLTAWFREGHRALIAALESAPADLEAWTFLDAPTPLAFWARRQAHETAIHRIDAETAAGDVTGFPAAFAADGIDELLLRFAGRPGRPIPVDEPRSMLVRALDVPRTWHVTFAPEGLQVLTDPTAPAAEVVVTASASDLYTMLWNRRDPAGDGVEGQADVLALWRETVQIRWS